MKRLLEKIIPRSSPHPMTAPPGPPRGLPRALTEELACGVHLRVLAAVRTIEESASLATADAVNPLVSLMDSGDWEIRSAAIEALAKVGTPALEALFGLLNAPDTDVRCDAAWALGVVGDGSAIAPLLNALTDPEPRVQGFIANALGKIRDPRGIPALIELLASSEPNVRSTAASMLGRMGKPAVHALSDAYAKAASDLRPTILWALGELAQPEALDLLLTALNDRDAAARAAAASSVGRFSTLLQTNPRRGTFIARLISMLNDDSLEARQHAAFALAGLNDPEARQTAFQAMLDALDSPQPLYRAGAALILGEFGDKRATDPLRLLLLRERDAAVRHAAKTALETLRSR